MNQQSYIDIYVQAAPTQPSSPVFSLQHYLNVLNISENYEMPATPILSPRPPPYELQDDDFVLQQVLKVKKRWLRIRKRKSKRKRLSQVRQDKKRKEENLRNQ